MTTSVAGKVLQSRAIQCSFSSVFHLRKTGVKKEDADFVENLFIATCGVPLMILGISGLGVSISNAWSQKR